MSLTHVEQSGEVIVTSIKGRRIQFFPRLPFLQVTYTTFVFVSFTVDSQYGDKSGIFIRRYLFQFFSIASFSDIVLLSAKWWPGRYR